MQERIKVKKKKTALLYILQILRKNSDCDHKLKQADILRELHSEYGIDLDRRAVARNIKLLKDVGYEIIDSGNSGCYLVAEFTDGELQLLIDGVLCSKHISASNAKELAAKLCDLGRDRLNSGLRDVQCDGGAYRESTPALFSTIEDLHIAIQSQRKVRFYYTDYAIEKGKIHKTSGSVFVEKIIVDPYRLAMHKGEYYLLGESCEGKGIVHFRIDKIAELEIISEESAPLEASAIKDMSVEQYLAERPFMGSGCAERVEMKIPDYRLGDFIDAFGNKFAYTTTADGRLRVCVNATITDATAWALIFGKDVEVVSPVSVRERVAETIASMAQTYTVKSDTSDDSRQSEAESPNACYPLNIMQMIFGERIILLGDVKELKKTLTEACKALSQAEKMVYMRVYRMSEPREQVAELFDMGQEDLLRIEARLLFKMRRPSVSRKLVSYIYCDESADQVSEVNVGE